MYANVYQWPAPCDVALQHPRIACSPIAAWRSGNKPEAGVVEPDWSLSTLDNPHCVTQAEDKRYRYECLIVGLLSQPLDVRAAEINGELSNRLRAPFRQPELNVPPIFKPKTPLLRAA